MLLKHVKHVVPIRLRQAKARGVMGGGVQYDKERLLSRQKFVNLGGKIADVKVLFFVEQLKIRKFTADFAANYVVSPPVPIAG